MLGIVSDLEKKDLIWVIFLPFIYFLSTPSRAVKQTTETSPILNDPKTPRSRDGGVSVGMLWQIHTPESQPPPQTNE